MLKLIAFLLHNTLKSSKLYFGKISQPRPMLIWLIILDLNDLPLLSSHLCQLLSESQRTRSYAIFFFTIVYWFIRRRPRQPTPVLLPGKSHGRRSLVGCSPWGREESDTTEWLPFHFHALEKAVATHSSVLAWRIPGQWSLVGCRLWGSTESDTTEVT